MAADDGDLLADYRVLSANAGLDRRIEALQRITDKVLAPVGGPWQKGEVLYFSASGEDATRRDDWVDFFESLVGP